MMNLTELKSLPYSELSALLEKLYKHLFELRLKNSARQLQDTSQLRKVRHEIAQLKMLLIESNRRNLEATAK
ncbi:MAG: 50S ribosomal protein L29 [Candidatus Melainabacteria bacterium]|nr:50S ribosomal protein L29 [Candidatus Melainabacteria bacterium]